MTVDEIDDALPRGFVRVAQSPVHPGVMRPSGVTAVASATRSPAPPTARLPRWTRCQSFGRPSVALY
jgi:hypothetical protein